MSEYKHIENTWNNPILWADGSPVEGPKLSPQEWERIMNGVKAHEKPHKTDEK